MIEPVIERHTADADAKRAHVGEIGEALASGWMLLGENHLPLRAVQPLPQADTLLQDATNARRKTRVPTEHLTQDDDRAQGGFGLQHRHDLRLPDRQGIGTSAGRAIPPCVRATGDRHRAERRCSD